MPGQELRQVRADRHRTDARAASAVRYAERLVQIQMRNVGAEFARRRQPDQRIEVCAIDVDLTAVGVHDLADVADARFEHTVRRRIGDHDGGEVGAMRFGLGLEILQVDVAAIVARNDHHLHAGHLGGRRIGAVRRRGNQAHVAVASPRDAWYARMISSPAYSPCEPALGCSDTAA